MKKLHLLTFFVLLTLVYTTPSLSDHHKKSESAFKITPITDDLLLLQGRGGNIALSRGSDGILIIDDDYPDLGDDLKKTIDKLGKGSNLKFILNTHWHGDHTGNNASLNADETINIVAHTNVLSRMGTRQEMRAFNRVIEAQAKPALPTITFPQSMTLHFNDEVIMLEHYPNGHTDGDSVIFFKKSNVVHMGDHMFGGMFPFVDLGSGGNAISFANNVGAVLAKIDDNTKVIPGHGKLTDKKGVAQFHNMLTSTIDEVRAMKSGGLSLEKAQGKGLSDQWKKWGGGFIKEPAWISIIYNSL